MRRLIEATIGDRRARIITFLALTALAAMLVFLPTSTPQEAANNRLYGYIAAGLAALVLIVIIGAEASQASYTRATMQADSEARAALKTGRAMPIPPLPRQLSKIQRDRQPAVENYTRQLISIPWGKRPTISEPELRPLFDKTVTFVRRVPGDWSKFYEPIQIFANMPAPWCYIGAAEVLQRLSFLVGGLYSPVGLRQGLRFIAQAQAVDPDNADALITRARLLTSVSDPYWLRLAGDALQRAQAIAPNHFRLPITESVYFGRYNQKEKALACLEQAIARAPSPEDLIIARISYADRLQDMGRNEEAVSAYRTLLETEQNDPWLWHNMSIALYDLGRYDEALSANQRALSNMTFNAAMVRGEMIRKKIAERDRGVGMA